MNDTTNNPYIGPRTFLKEEGHLFFGRDREARDLSALVVSENLVLFYAQSGAGKSSLINTCLIPELEQKEYEVLPVARVSGELPDGPHLENVYTYNLMRSIIRREIDPETLAGLSLSQFLGRLNEDDDGYFYDAAAETSYRQNTGFTSWPRALVIDQFEELFSTHLDSWERRDDFFKQLAQAMLDDPYLWVVLVMRDDYIALLDPYAHLLSGSLRARYYMQRFSREAAVKAIKGPVEGLRPYDDDVAETLVENLASITVQSPDGGQIVRPGQYVEPVQLQVVCYGLWEHLTPGGNKITSNDLDEVGDVDQSLENFYSHRVESVALEKGISERIIREWFGSELITSSGTRNMILRESDEAAGLGVDVIEAFKGDLIRAELRAGQIWYELSHDRLIDPVCSSNTKWYEQHLSLFQRRVVLWTQQGKTDSLLLRDRELDDAEKESANLQLTVDEQEFLDECRKLRVHIQRDRRQRRVIIAALIVSIVLLVVAGISYFDARRSENVATKAQLRAVEDKIIAQNAEADARVAEANALASEAEALEHKRIAEEQANKALAGSLTAYADSVKNNDHALALLLGVEAYQRETNLLTRATLFDLLQFSPYTRLFGFKGPVSSIVVSPDGMWVIASSSDQINVIDPKTNQVVATLPAPAAQAQGTTDLGLVNSLAFNPDGSLLAAAGCLPEGCQEAGGQITLWDMRDPQAPLLLADIREGHSAQIKAVAFSPDGMVLASGSYDQTVILWDASFPGTLRPFADPLFDWRQNSLVTSLAFSPEGTTLISGSDDGVIHLWNVANPANPGLIGTAPPQHIGSIYGMAFGPPGSGKFASASDDRTVTLWAWNPNASSLSNPVKLEGHNGYVRAVAFNADGSQLASASFDTNIIIWDVQTGERVGSALDVHNRPVDAIAFGVADTQNVLFSGGDDRTVILWDRSTRAPLSQPVAVMPVSDGLGKIATFGDIEATVDGQQIHVQNGSGVVITLHGHTGLVNTLAFGQQEVDGHILLASASDDQSVILWDVTDLSTAGVFLKLDGFESPVTAAFFDEDLHLISVDGNGETVRWVIQPSEWLKRACAAAKRELTELEWEQYLPGQGLRDTCSDYATTP